MPEEPKLISMPVRVERLIEMMQTPKDIHVVMSADGSYVTTCNKCNIVLLRATAVKPLPLVWWKCPICERVTFSVPDNLTRDGKIAESLGGTFGYDVCFMKDLPPELLLPTEWHGQ